MSWYQTLSSWLRPLAVSAGLVMLAFATACRTTPEPPPGPILTRSLTVSRHASSNLTAKRADEILRDMTTIIQVRDTRDDVACPVEFVRQGEVEVFGLGTGSINGAADFAAVTGLPGVVKVVNQIHWCGAFSPNILGCAPLGGDSMVVVRWQANLEGILWLHEYGHLQGLGHRDEAGAVMNSVIHPSHRSVDDVECAFFKP
jgi:hypothetical protein